MPQLLNLALNSNNLSGPLPDEWGRNSSLPILLEANLVRHACAPITPSLDVSTPRVARGHPAHDVSVKWLQQGRWTSSHSLQAHAQGLATPHDHRIWLNMVTYVATLRPEPSLLQEFTGMLGCCLCMLYALCAPEVHRSPSSTGCMCSRQSWCIGSQPDVVGGAPDLTGVQCGAGGQPAYVHHPGVVAAGRVVACPVHLGPCTQQPGGARRPCSCDCLDGLCCACAGSS